MALPKVLFIRKDGGCESNVTGYWLIEWKNVFSLAFLKFTSGIRENFHSHAFNSWSWILSGSLWEEILNKPGRFLNPSFKPVYISKNQTHRVHGLSKSTWAITFRGPWDKTWIEVTPQGKTIELTHGRAVCGSK